MRLALLPCLSLSLALGVAACSTEDPWPLRGAGGGGTIGGGENPADPDAATDGGGNGFTGTVCIVDDLSDPHACPALSLARDVLIEDAGGTIFTRSDDTGAFMLSLPGPTVTLRLAADDTLLVPSLDEVTTTDGPVEAKVVEATAWEDTLLTLIAVAALDPGTGAILVEVTDASGPVQGATISASEPNDYGIFYDDGVGGWDSAQAGTGPGGLALILGVATAGAVSVGANDGTRTGTDAITVESESVSFAAITL